MDLKDLVLIYAIIFCFVGIEGCSDTYSEDEAFVLESGYHVSYKFVLVEGDYLDVSVKTAGGPVDVIITDSNNFYKYEDEYSEEFEYYQYHENVIAKETRFIAPDDGEYYMILENNEPNNVEIEISYEVY